MHELIVSLLYLCKIESLELIAKTVLPEFVTRILLSEDVQENKISRSKKVLYLIKDKTIIYFFIRQNHQISHSHQEFPNHQPF